MLRRLPLAYGAYVIAALALPLSYPVTAQPLMSLPRFLVVLFPLSMWLAAWLAAHPRAQRPALARLGPADGVLRSRSSPPGTGSPSAVDDLTSAPGSERPAYLPDEPGRIARRFDSPRTAWPPWTAPVALISGLVVAVVGALLVDVPALALGVNVSAQHLPDGLQVADTAVQDAGFVLRRGVLRAARRAQRVRRGSSACARRRCGAPCAGSCWSASASSLFSLLWKVAVNPPEEKVLEQIGTGVLSAALTCVVAPIGEEFLFRGYIFTALRNWRGPWTAAVITGLLFGLVHVGSAPLLDLVPLAALGFGLCLLYRRTGSLYPCIALHSLNNSVAFGQLAKWNWQWQIPLLAVASLASIALLAVRAHARRRDLPRAPARNVSCV